VLHLCKQVKWVTSCPQSRRLASCFPLEVESRCFNHVVLISGSTYGVNIEVSRHHAKSHSSFSTSSVTVVCDLILFVTLRYYCWLLVEMRLHCWFWLCGISRGALDT